MANEMQIVRSIFQYGFEGEMIEKPVRFGPGFKKPLAKIIRLTRIAEGPQMVAPDAIRRLLHA